MDLGRILSVFKDENVYAYMVVTSVFCWVCFNKLLVILMLLFATTTVDVIVLYDNCSLKWDVVCYIYSVF